LLNNRLVFRLALRRIRLGGKKIFAKNLNVRKNKVAMRVNVKNIPHKRVVSVEIILVAVKAPLLHNAFVVYRIDEHILGVIAEQKRISKIA